MTYQEILDTMELLDQELQLQPSEADVSRALIAINRAVDYFEVELSKYPDILGDYNGNVVTAASTESTAFPSGLLRLDRLQLLGSDSLPLWDVTPIERTGGHRRGWRWPYYIGLSTTSPGKPTGYYTDGRRIYWDPIPDAVHTIRWYGLRASPNAIADAMFPFPDQAALAIASFAASLMKIGLGDDLAEIGGLATQQFSKVIEGLDGFHRDGPSSYDYTYLHTT